MRSIKRVHVIVGAVIAILVALALPRDLGYPVVLAICIAVFLYSLAEVGWQLFKDARWLVNLIGRLFGRVRRDRSGGRTTPDRSDP